MADIELWGATTTTLVCRAIDLPAEANMIRWYIGLTEDDMPYQGYVSIAMDNWPAFGFYELSPNTAYYVKMSVRDADQNAIGDAVTRRFSTNPIPPRPSNWSWESTVSAGQAINMTAAEFNRFIDRVYEFLEYKEISDGSEPSYLYVTQGAQMRASDVNIVRSYIADMRPPTALPAEVLEGDTIRASFFNGLKNSLNSIT